MSLDPWPHRAAVLADARQDDRRAFHQPDLADDLATGWDRVDVEQQEMAAGWQPDFAPTTVPRR